MVSSLALLLFGGALTVMHRDGIVMIDGWSLLVGSLVRSFV